MSLTLGLTGMDPATETALKAAFIEANARLGGRWSLVSDAEAEHVVVDMDSMYGPMSWLRLHAAGRHVVGLTSAPRTQTDYRLGRPFDTEQLVALLADIAQGAGVELQDSAGDPRDVPASPALAPALVLATARGPEPAPASAPATTPTPTPIHIEAGPVVPDSATADSSILASTPEAAAVPQPEPAASVEPGPEPEPGQEPQPDPAPATPPTERTLAAWLVPGALHNPVRYRRSAGPTLLIDPAVDRWHGPTPLRPIAPYFEGIVDEAEFEALDAAAWARETASAGPAQPLSRLRWLGGLLAGGGRLLAGLEPDARFQLTRWPQTEREYPRHFRIATQMMKGPATVDEIAEASGVPAADVSDFVNASIATGFAEPVIELPPSAEESVKPRGGLLGRLRNR